MSEKIILNEFNPSKTMPQCCNCGDEIFGKKFDNGFDEYVCESCWNEC